MPGNLLLALILLTCSVALRAETLGEAVRRALETFPEVRGSVANQRATLETVSQARAQFLPSIDASLAQGRERSNNPSTRSLGGAETLSRSEAQITLSQMIFDGGVLSSQVRRQQARSESALGRLYEVAETVAFRVAQAFFDVLRLRELIAIAEQNVIAHQRTLQQVASTVRSGVGRRSDESQASARLALAESALTQMKGQLSEVEIAYRRLTGHPPGTLVKEAGPPTPAALEPVLENALFMHPALRAARQDLEAAVAERDLARARLAPQLTFELSATHNQDIDGLRGLNADQTAMLRLRHNFFRGGADTARLRETEARRDEAAAALAGVQNDIEREVRQAWDSLVRQRARLPALQLHAEASAEVVTAYRGQFQIGQRSLLDVLNSENESFTARSNYVSGEYAIALGAYQLLAAAGQMLPHLQLRPPGAQDDGGDEQKERK